MKTLALILCAGCLVPSQYDDTGAQDADPHDAGGQIVFADSATPALDTGGPEDVGSSEDPNNGTAGPTEGPCAEVPEGVDLSEEGFLFTTTDRRPVTLDFCIELDDDALVALEAAPGEDVHADLSFAGRTWEVGLHLKGSENGSFRGMDEKAAFKVDVHEWLDEQRMFGVKRLTLNNMIQDPTMAAEHAAYALFAASGVPSARHGYARVYVNGELFGLYGVVETADEQLLDRLFGDKDANLYEGGYGADLYDWAPEKFEVQEGDEDRTDLIELIDAIESCPEDGLLDLLDTWFHRDALLAMWAVELVTSNRDGYTTWGNNFLLAHPTDDLWWMLPWGPDQSFSGDTEEEIGVYDELYGRLAARCRAEQSCSEALDLAVIQVLSTWDDLGFADLVEATTLAIENDCRNDPRSLYGDYGCRDHQATLRDWVEARPDEVQNQLDKGPG